MMQLRQLDGGGRGRRFALVVLVALAVCGISARAEWFRGNLHTHTFWSDGNGFPEEVAAWYRARGYQFLGLSDHNVLSRGERWMTAKDIDRRSSAGAAAAYLERHPDAKARGSAAADNLEVQIKPLTEVRRAVESAGAFLLIESEEITDRFEKLPVHLNAINLDELIPPQGGTNVLDVVERNLAAVARHRAASGRPVLVFLNHPDFKYAITGEVLAESSAHLFEAHNAGGEAHLQGDALHPSVQRQWDIANTLRIAGGRPPLLGVGTDDTHHYYGKGHLAPGRAWVMVRGERLEAGTLVAAMERGDFYVSTGVALRDVAFDAKAGRLAVEVAPEDGVSYTIRFVGTRKGFDAASAPRLGDDGNPAPNTTRVYSSDIGCELAVVNGAKAAYTLKGDELYVRAIVTSDRPHPIPSWEGQTEQAFTQPVGWRRWIEETSAAATP